MNQFARFVTPSRAALARLAAAARSITPSRVALGGLVAAASSAHAAIDATEIKTEITAQLAVVGIIGLAILSVCVAIAAFMWLRKLIK